MENLRSNKTQALTKRMKMDIWIGGKSNRLFISSFYIDIESS